MSTLRDRSEMAIQPPAGVVGRRDVGSCRRRFLAVASPIVSRVELATVRDVGMRCAAASLPCRAEVGSRIDVGIHRWSRRRDASVLGGVRHSLRSVEVERAIVALGVTTQRGCPGACITSP